MPRILAADHCPVRGLARAGVRQPAQDWPTRPVRIIVPLAPGGGGDVFARLLGEELAEAPRPAVRGGEPARRRAQHRHAGLRRDRRRTATRSASLRASRSSTNQFTLQEHAVQPRDRFRAITLLFFNPIALVTNKHARRQDHRGAGGAVEGQARHAELRARSRSRPCISWTGLKKNAGADWVYVPYRSGNEVVNAVVTGATPVAFLGLANMLGQLRSGLITGIALNANARSPLFPDLPTLGEAGAERLSAGLVRTVRAARHAEARSSPSCNAEIARITSEPAWRQKNFIDRAIEPAVNTPEEFAAFIVRERKIRRADRPGIRPAAAVTPMHAIATFDAARRVRRRGDAGRVAPAAAQDWPSRPVRIVIPARGRRRRRRVHPRDGRGIAEGLAPAGRGREPPRRRAEHRRPRLRRGRARRLHPLRAVERAAVYNQFLFKTLPYDPEKDLQPIVNLFFNMLARRDQQRHQGEVVRRADRAGQSSPARSATRTFSFPLTHFMEQAEQGRGHRHREGAVPGRRRGGQRACSAARRRSRCWRSPT